MKGRNHRCYPTRAPLVPISGNILPALHVVNALAAGKSGLEVGIDRAVGAGNLRAAPVNDPLVMTATERSHTVGRPAAFPSVDDPVVGADRLARGAEAPRLPPAVNVITVPKFASGRRPVQTVVNGHGVRHGLGAGMTGGVPRAVLGGPAADMQETRPRRAESRGIRRRQDRAGSLRARDGPAPPGSSRHVQTFIQVYQTFFVIWEIS